MRNEQNQQPKYIIFDFDKLWRFMPLHRPQKELLKQLLFSGFPFIFSRLAAFQNWKNAQIFRNKESYFRRIVFAKRRFSNADINHKQVASENIETPKSFTSLAVAIHAFYPEIFGEIIELLEQSKFRNLSLYVTVPSQSSPAIEQLLNKSSYKYQIYIVENHGRDILPFLKILPKIFDDGHQLVLKLHTKGSNHLNKKELWKNDLFEKLIGKGTLAKNVQLFNQNNMLGILGPTGHIVPMYFYYGANALHVKMMSDKLGIETRQLQNLCFVAGSMFFARKEALMPILHLGLSENDFEQENSQLDGTMAHAVERAFGLGLIVSGLKLADSSSTPEKISCRITMDHYFTV